MGRVISDMSMSMDGFVAAPGATRQQPVGAQEQQLHPWPADSGTAPDEEIPHETAEAPGAVIMGRRSYDRYEDDRDGYGPLGTVPCFVLTHRPPARSLAPSASGFVTDGIESAVRQARAAAGGADVGLHGRTAAQQCLRAGLLDELRIRLVPVLLGEGIRLFDHLGTRRVGLERTRVVTTSGTTHLWFRVLRP